MSECSEGRRVSSDGWAATDALGRRLCTHVEAGSKRKDKIVAMFYWTWHQGEGDASCSVRNITEILRGNPEAMRDYGHPAWGERKPGFFYWEQPLFGYYRTTDPWVLRKHAEMLADAGVDVVFFDCTNASLTWKESYEALMQTWSQARKDGVAVPKVAFLLPFKAAPHSRVSLRQLYRDVYQPGLYEELWFIWKGKPLIMAYPDNLTSSPEDLAIADFFTFRPGQPDYVDGPQRPDQWGWLENYPQHGYVKNDAGRYEQVPVGVAQNAAPSTGGHCSAFNLPGSQGRSYSKRHGVDPRVDGYLYGWNFQEQWSRAFELDPELVFVTGWNEYIAGQWLPKHGWTGEPFSFVDQFDWERSRDIEPNKGWGDKGDVYYLQLVDFVRRFKGMDAPPPVSAPGSITIGQPGQWERVEPWFAHYRGNTMHRNHPGRNDRYYSNTSGRNDIVGSKVARDDERVFFMVETAEALTPSGERNWMMLFLDMDRDHATGWNGYDFVVNRKPPEDGMALLERNIGGRWEWERCGRVPFVSTGNRLEIAIPKLLLGFEGRSLDMEFKWSDNMQENGDIMDFYINGDAAPGGRFNFVYAETSGR